MAACSVGCAGTSPSTHLTCKHGRDSRIPHSTGAGLSTLPKIEQTLIVAERLSARHVIAEYCVEIVCLYIIIYIYVTLRNAISPYGEAHTVVLYARATRAAIARPRDCTFFHNYSTFFHNSTTKWTIRLPISLSMHRPHQRYCD